jgi:hypothetical protein
MSEKLSDYERVPVKFRDCRKCDLFMFAISRAVWLCTDEFVCSDTTGEYIFKIKKTGKDAPARS